MNQQTKISMEQFLRSGEFGRITLGDSADKIRGALGEPTAAGGITRKQKTPTIWKYGDIEFHFSDNGSRLWMIFCDGFEKLNLGPAVSLDAWFFVGQPSAESVKQHPVNAKLDYHQLEAPHEPGVLLLRLASGVELLLAKFTNPAMHPPQPGLFGFQYCNETN